jgi:predicted dehydrogenase
MRFGLLNSKNVLRIGALGAAVITPHALIKPARGLQGVEVVAVAARDCRRARTFADEHGISRVFDTYQAMLEDPGIDAIYNPLPNGLHCAWTIKALEAGKHVLCEKPLGNNADEARLMVEASQRTGLILMEAFHYRHHPLMARVRELVPALGHLKRIETKFCFLLPRFNDIRYNYSLGGGATMDVGAYTCDMLRQLALAGGDPELTGIPQVKWARARLLRPYVDRAMEAELKWPNGCSGHMVHSLWAWRLPAIKLHAVGERGQLRVLNPVTPQHGHRLWVKIGSKSHQEQVPGKTTYHYQLQEFERRIREEAASPDLQESIATMELIDAIYTAAGLPLRGVR